MRRADQATIEGGTPGEVLMERAGRALARAALRVTGDRYATRIAVVCGKGNNAGDGYVAARVLHEQGCAVGCFNVFDPSSLTGDAATHYRRMIECGVRVETFGSRALRADVVVDAIFGTGFRGSPEGPAREAIVTTIGSGIPVVAADIPSGVDGATGKVEDVALRAEVTVAMGAEKLGTFLEPGRDHSGDVEVATIGIGLHGYRAAVLEVDDTIEMLPDRPAGAHKRTSGSVAILAGSDAYAGAALLTARGAQRMGAGFVELGCPDGVRRLALGRMPELVTHEVVGQDAKGFEEALERADAVAVGPGLGRSADATTLVTRILDGFEGPVVVDADALNALADDPGALMDRAAPTVLTPHPAELGRLLGSDAAAVQSDRLGAAREAAERFGCVVLLKGRSTVVYSSARQPEAVFVPTGGPELATAGTGDVLTGAIAALLPHCDERNAAAAAAFVHGLAGSRAAVDRGPTGVTAWDVAENLGPVRDDLAGPQRV
jgi:NAD(P)H-hydrate epimerase